MKVVSQGGGGNGRDQCAAILTHDQFPGVDIYWLVPYNILRKVTSGPRFV